MRTETFSTPGAVSLDVRLGAGEVALEAAATEETTVELEPLRDNDASHAAVDEARVECLQNGDRHEVVVDVRQRRSGLFGRGAEVLVRVKCPLESAAGVRAGSADVRGRGVFGSVEVETGSGDVEFSDISHDAQISAASGDVEVRSIGGEGRINTASGDVEVGLLGGDGSLNTASGDVIIKTAGGTLRVNSASGDVIVKEALSSVTVNTASGDQILGSVVSSRVDLKSASGDFRIGIKEGSQLFVDARSRSGEVRSELPVSDAPPEGDAPLVELRANTMSGDISIVRAGS